MGQPKSQEHKAKLREAYHNRPKEGVPDATIPPWVVNGCSHKHTEVSSVDRTGLATQTCYQCGAHRLIPANMFLIQEGLRLGQIRYVVPAGSKYSTRSTFKEGGIGN
jgi:hypothetical protein